MNLHSSTPAREIFELAFEEAARRGHDSIRAEHILLGVVALHAGAASACLDEVGANRDALRAQLESALPLEVDPGRQLGEMPYAYSGQQVLQHAMDELRTTGADALDTRHVLVGALVPDDGPGARAFAAARVPVADLIRLLREGGRGDETSGE
jgi:ATP-dependent Clp protease ATP-binding subunit ClpA